MARPGLMPIASAVVLTVAAALTLATEHARSSQAAALAAQHEAPAAAAPSPAVGSRALIGHEEDCPAADKQQP